jgi:hypothetical protein
MSYIVKNDQVIDLTTNTEINLQSITCNDYFIVHNPTEAKYYLIAITYLFDTDITNIAMEYADCINDETYFVNLHEIHYFAEIYTLPDLKFIGFIPSINYYDFGITPNGIVDLKQKIIYIPTKDGIILQKY